MNKQDIIRMAREAGFSEAWLSAGENPPHFEAPAVIVERFAALVAEAQRQWVGLTTEDMATCIDEPAWDLILRKAEQILKEKNT